MKILSLSIVFKRFHWRIISNLQRAKMNNSIKIAIILDMIIRITITTVTKDITMALQGKKIIA